MPGQARVPQDHCGTFEMEENQLHFHSTNALQLHCTILNVQLSSSLPGLKADMGKSANKLETSTLLTGQIDKNSGQKT